MTMLPYKLRIWLQIRKVKRMKKRCDHRKELTGRQHFLIELNNGKLAIVNSDYIKGFNKLLKGRQRPMTFIDLHNFAIYKTK